MPGGGTYIMFAGAHYYPAGGVDDQVDCFAAPDDETAIREATRVAEEKRPGGLPPASCWWHLARVTADGLTIVHAVEEY